MAEQFIVQDDDTNFNGWRFCSTCQNLLIPLKANTNSDSQQNTIVQFKCNSCSSIVSSRRDRDITVNVNIDLDRKRTGDKEKLLMKRNVLERTKAADIYNRDMVLDDTMQRKQIECPICHYDEAVFYLKTDNNEPQIIIQYICARGSDEGVAECAYTWNKYTQQEEEMQEVQQQDDNDIDFSSDEDMKQDEGDLFEAEQEEEQVEPEQDDAADLFDDDDEMDN